MPGLVAHHHFAISALKSAPDYVKDAVMSSPGSFRLGAQGPNILYFHNAPLSSKTSDLGREFHRNKIHRTFNGMIKYAVLQGNTQLLSYILGFICHYILDRQAHPFISYIAQNKLAEYYNLDKKSLHQLCESDIDAAVITNYITGEQHTYKAYNLLKFDKMIALNVGQLISNIGWDVYGIKTSSSKVIHSVRNMMSAYKLFHDETGGRTRDLEIIEKTINKRGHLATMVRPVEPLKQDCINSCHEVWLNPYTQISSICDFFELLEANMRRCIDLMSLVYDSYHKNIALSEVFFRLNYEGQIQSM